jgi:hypothetical protein
MLAFDWFAWKGYLCQFLGDEAPPQLNLENSD